MTGLGSSLSFRNNSDTVYNANNQKRTLSGKARKQKVLYIREKDSILYFGCEGEPVPHTQLAVCMPSEIKEEAIAFVEYINE